MIKPPHPIDLEGKRSVFLAGSIEMGRAVDWQSELTREMATLDVVVLNPRRDEWDATWVQAIDNPMFREQVEWELLGQEVADVIAFYFAPDTKAPVTMLELGLAVGSGKAVVCCPDGFWRKGNVDISCARYGAKQVASLAELAKEVRARLLECPPHPVA